MCGHTRDPVTYSKFHRNPFRGFGAPGGQNLAFSITVASRFYNSLYFVILFNFFRGVLSSLYVNMCACHMYFNKLTYLNLLTTAQAVI